MYAVIQLEAGDADAPLDAAILFQLSPDAHAFWDKSCGYDFHMSCPPDAPQVLLGAGAGAVKGFPNQATTTAGAFVSTIVGWATTHPEDDNARYARAILVPRAIIEATPYLLFAHGEGEPVAPELLALYLNSAIVDRTAPADAACAVPLTTVGILVGGVPQVRTVVTLFNATADPPSNTSTVVGNATIAAEPPVSYSASNATATISTSATPTQASPSRNATSSVSAAGASAVAASALVACLGALLLLA